MGSIVLSAIDLEGAVPDMVPFTNADLANIQRLTSPGAASRDEIQWPGLSLLFLQGREFIDTEVPGAIFKGDQLDAGAKHD